MNEANTYKSISECVEAFPSLTESSLRRWIRNGKIPQDALLITESVHKSGRMVTLIDVDQLAKIIQKKSTDKKQKTTVASIGTNQMAGNWEQIKAPYEDFIEYLKQEVENQRLRAEEAEERAKKVEKQLRQLTHQPPSESKAEGKRSEWISNALIYGSLFVVLVVMVFLMLQQMKYL